MTIKRQWLLVLVLIAVISVVINSLLLSSLTNQYFQDYIKDNYNRHFNQIVEYLSGALEDESLSSNQLAIELETHLTDPITRIKVYDLNGVLIADVSKDLQSYIGDYSMNGKMNNMMNHMMGSKWDNKFEEVDHVKITNNGSEIGQVNITKYSSVEHSYATQMFQSSLLKNSIISIGIVLIISVVIGILVSNKMSKDLINTAEIAQNIDLGKETKAQRSKIKEISVIQQSLESAQSRLKLKQKGRKALIDELVHQTRTPLTILRTHLEGIEDGVIDMNSEEIQICESQIDNITAIITNMSSMIDAEKTDTVLAIEEFELSQLVKQIVNGLKAQFEKKNIDFKALNLGKVMVKTDKYRLSQAIYNILTNAYKYTPSNGKVYITYQVLNEKIILTIEDSGSGISKDDMGKIFNAYYKKIQ